VRQQVGLALGRLRRCRAADQDGFELFGDRGKRPVARDADVIEPLDGNVFLGLLDARGTPADSGSLCESSPG